MNTRNDELVLKVPISAGERSPAHFRDLREEFERMSAFLMTRTDNVLVLDVQPGEGQMLYVFVRPVTAGEAYSYTFTRKDCEIADAEQHKERMEWMEACDHCLRMVQRALCELASQRAEQAARIAKTAQLLDVRSVEPIRRISTPPPRGGS